MIRLVTISVVVALASTADAGPRKVLVLPLDGSAPAETRKKLSVSFQKMARLLDGEVDPGNATLGDTAAAINCDPVKLKCVENVRATLGVDELVYGTADESNGTITVVAKRYRKGKKPREITVNVAPNDPPNKVEAELLPAFGSEPLPDDPQGDALKDPNGATGTTGTITEIVTAPDPVKEETQTDRPAVNNRERNIAIGVTAGGGVLLALGLALWAQTSSLQDDIDDHPRNTPEDFANLTELEDKASARGWAGNIFIIAGLAVAGYGGYRLYKHYKSEPVTVTPTPVEGGAAVTLRGVW
jgi:hypothetical protein